MKNVDLGNGEVRHFICLPYKNIYKTAKIFADLLGIDLVSKEGFKADGYYAYEFAPMKTTYKIEYWYSYRLGNAPYKHDPRMDEGGFETKELAEIRAVELARINCDSGSDNYIRRIVKPG